MIFKNFVVGFSKEISSQENISIEISNSMGSILWIGLIYAI
jgi:hypothetical protein